jgi:chromosome segregation ATPase
MTNSPKGAAGRDRERGPDAMERARQVERDRGRVEEVVRSLRADEQRLLSDTEALKVERTAIERELGEVRDRVAGLDASLTVRQLGMAAKEREVADARAQLETQRDLAERIERELAEHRAQIAGARKRLGALIEDALRIQHKVWRAANSESLREDRDGWRER